MGADDAEQEGQLTDSSTASSYGRGRVGMPDAVESATEDELTAPSGAASNAAAASLLLRRGALANGRPVAEEADGDPGNSGAAAGLVGAAARRAADKEEALARRPREEAADCQDSFFDWSSLDAAPAQVLPTKISDPAWEAAGDVVEDAVEGLVSFATSVAGSVAGAVSAVGDAFGHTGSMAGAVLALGEATARANHGSAPPGVKSLESLTISMPLKPSAIAAGGPVESAKQEVDHLPVAPMVSTTSEEEEGPVARASAKSASLLRRRAPSRGPKHGVLDMDLVPRGAPTPRVGKFRIAMVINGSEGDVRPLVALGKILAEEMGHQVRVLTNANLVHVSLRHGVDAVPVFANSQAVIQKCGGMRGSFMEAVIKPTKVAEKWLKDHEGEYIPVADALEDFEPHAILAGSQVSPPVVARYEKMHSVPVMPVFLSREWLEEEFFNMLVNKEPPRPSFYAVSEVIDRKPLPFPRMMRTSAWVLNETPSLEDLSPGGSLCELKEFLDRGPPPVAVGWGSMLAVNLPPAEMLELALRALMQAGRRGVVMGGWAELDRVAAVAADGRLPSRLSDGGKLATWAKEQVCFVPWAPHDWLFPQCCCVIHHGGVGTLHAVLRACRPSVVTPICADQFAHAQVVTNSHVGVGFTKALPDLKPKDLAHAIGLAVSNVTTIAAQTVGRKLLREEGQGVTRAAEMVDGFIRGKIKLGKSGQWVKRVAKKTAAIELAGGG